MDVKDLLKAESLGLVKTLAPIVASLGVAWSYVEPYVEEYVQEQVHIVQEEDKILIDSLKNELKELKHIVDEDYITNIDKRNQIIEEIRRVFPSTRLGLENR